MYKIPHPLFIKLAVESQQDSYKEIDREKILRNILGYCNRKGRYHAQIMGSKLWLSHIPFNVLEKVGGVVRKAAAESFVLMPKPKYSRPANIIVLYN